MKNNELEKLINEYEAIIVRCENLTSGLTVDQLNWKPSPDKWSIAECLRHLTITNNLYYQNAKPALLAALQKNISKNKNSPIKFGIIGKIFMGFEPPLKRKFKVPKVFSPKTKSNTNFSKDVISDFIISKRNMIDLMRKSDSVDLNKVKVSSPVTKFIRIRLGEYFSIMAPHDRRHLWQAENVRNLPNFPFV